VGGSGARVGALVGTTGLARIGYEAPFAPAVEVAWRFVPSAWARGYATEAASASLDHDFDAAGLEEIVAMTAPVNTRSP